MLLLRRGTFSILLHCIESQTYYLFPITIPFLSIPFFSFVFIFILFCFI